MGSEYPLNRSSRAKGGSEEESKEDERLSEVIIDSKQGGRKNKKERTLNNVGGSVKRYSAAAHQFVAGDCRVHEEVTVLWGNGTGGCGLN